MPIRNIIFDLGGLFIDVYMERFRAELELITGRSLGNELQSLQTNGLFDAYEKGEISSATFIKKLSAPIEPQLEASAYKKCWNAILGEFRLDNLALTLELRNSYNLVLLSNTNEMHVNALEKQLRIHHGATNLQPWFDQVYYSNEIKLRKPDAAIFAFVLNSHQWQANETLFIDDSAGHLKGAAALGIHTQLHPGNEVLVPTLEKAGLI